jgi:hypothetical protein
MNETVSMPLPTADDRQHVVAYLRHLADRIEAEDQPTDAPGPRPRLDWARVELDRELAEPVIYDAFPWQQRIIQEELGQSVALRLHWRFA